jgi:predicted ATPase
MHILTNRVAVVTGAASGIGRATALQLAAQGCRLALVDVNEEQLQVTAAELARDQVEVSAHRVDVADRGQMARLVDEVLAHHGRVHILVNNAGKENPEMSASSHPDFRTTELDPDLLSTFFGVQTNWHVLTGAPCSGKTTPIGQLADQGYRTVPEAGRLYVEGEMAKGRTTDEILENGDILQRGVLGLQLRSERGLPVNEVAFLDGGSPSCLTYFRVMGLNPNAILAECFHHRYASVFMLDRFPFQHDGVRFEDDATAGLIDEWLFRDYSALGYSVVRVPVLSIQDRLTFILEKLSEQ